MKFLQIASLLACASANEEDYESGAGDALYGGYANEGPPNFHNEPFRKSELRDIKGLEACHDDFQKDQDLDEFQDCVWTTFRKDETTRDGKSLPANELTRDNFRDGMTALCHVITDGNSHVCEDAGKFDAANLMHRWGECRRSNEYYDNKTHQYVETHGPVQSITGEWNHGDCVITRKGSWPVVFK